MNLQVIYDNEGVVLSCKSGSSVFRDPIGVPFLNAEVPSNKIVTGVDVSTIPHQVILEEIPPSDVEALRNEVEAAVMELTMLIYGGGL